MDYNIKVLDCPICNDCLINPYECKKCHVCVCKKCIQNGCIYCKKNEFFQNLGLNKILEKICFPCLNCNKIFKTRKELKNHKDIDKIELHECILCLEQFDFDDFYNHILQKHRNHLIEIFDSNSLYNKGEKILYLKNNSNQLNTEIINKYDSSKSNNIDDSNIQKERSIISVNVLQNINNSQSNIKTGKIFCINEDKNKNKTDNMDSLLSNSVNNSNIFSESNLDKKLKISTIQLSSLYYCKKQNNICTCCPSKKCIEGSCFCAGCMEYNCKVNKLKKGELINKKGRIANKYNGVYYCNITFRQQIQTYNGPIDVSIKCSYTANCKECKDLTVICKKYEDFIRYD